MSHDALLAQLRERGFVVLPAQLPAPALDGHRATLEPYFRRRRRDATGGFLLVHSLVARGRVIEESVLDDTVCSLAEALLGKDCLLTASVGICQLPRQPAGPVHHDDACYPLPRPRAALSLSTIWALDDFTTDNGAVEMVPGSHLWDESRTARAIAEGVDSVPVVMSAGSCVVFLGTVLHRGGANRTDGVRRGFTHEYCLPWLRPQENFFLTVPRGHAARMPPRLRAMLGYARHPPSFGHIGAGEPQGALDTGYLSPVETEERAIDTETAGSLE